MARCNFWNRLEVNVHSSRICGVEIPWWPWPSEPEERPATATGRQSDLVGFAPLSCWLGTILRCCRTNFEGRFRYSKFDGWILGVLWSLILMVQIWRYPHYPSQYTEVMQYKKKKLNWPSWNLTNFLPSWSSKNISISLQRENSTVWNRWHQALTLTLPSRPPSTFGIWSLKWARRLGSVGRKRARKYRAPCEIFINELFMIYEYLFIVI